MSKDEEEHKKILKQAEDFKFQQPSREDLDHSKTETSRKRRR